MSRMKYWKTKESGKIAYNKLENSHLMNILDWIKRKAKNGLLIGRGGGNCPDDFWYDEETIYGDEVLERYDYQELVEEFKRRKLP